MKFFSITIFVFLLVVLTFSVFAQDQQCSCLSASKKDIPSQGNMLIVSNIGKVKQIIGVVYIAGEEFMDNAVIEVFKTSESEIDKKVSYNGYNNDPEIARDQKIYEIAREKKRKTACITDKKGEFCFKNLATGVYILRIGLNISKRTDMNEVYFIVEVDEKNGKDNKIEASINVAN